MINGGASFAKALNNSIKGVNGTANSVLGTLAKEIERGAIDFAPKDTHYMANNIKAKKVTDLHHKVDSEAPYSGYVNFGTIHQEAQPFFSMAVDYVKDKDLASLGIDVGGIKTEMFGKDNGW